ncbi:hypothetical protein E4U41_007727 [Claviceps citrina]|nr:hypothetical protein E4U41_007727 [Claviceps citrina]
MFASFAQGRPGTAPAHNPFAAVPSKGETNPFGGFGADTQKQKLPTPKNPFQTEDAALSDGDGGDGGGGRQQKGKRGRLDGFAKKSQGKDGRGKGRKHDADQKNGFLATQKPDQQGSRATSPSSESSDAAGAAANDVTIVPYNPTDPLARKVYERLREDGISPPAWPSQPGNPNHKQAMARFREQYEAYRKKVRTSLTKAGLIDDPEKRKALSDAIEFKGICEDMCPEYEKITRITELDVVQAEKDPRTTYANTSKMVKKLARSAAGQEAPLPMDVRSVASLRRTLDYLMDDLLRNDGNLPVVHGFLWDRTRAIRRDFSFFSSLTPEEIKTQVYVLENIARFHVTSLHLLSQEGRAPEDFVQQQELEQLGKALLSLRDVYDDCGQQGIQCENESEFRAYYLLFHARDPSILETLQRQWKSRHWRDSDDVRTAVSLVEALQDTQEFHGPLKAGPSLAASAAFPAYFRIVQDPKVSYTMACFAECHFPQLRRSILQVLKRALSRPKDAAKDVTAAALNEFLQFDTVQQAIEFAELHNLEFESSPDDSSDVGGRVLILDGRRPLPHRRLQHQYSENMVERKRSRRPLPEVIHRTVFEDPNAAPLMNGSGAEESLFVPQQQQQQQQDDDGVNSQPKQGLGGFSWAGSHGSAFQTSSALPSSFGAPAGVQQASHPTSPFGMSSGSQQATATTTTTTTANNPFASTSTSSNSTPCNGFASTAPVPSFLASKKDGQGTMGAAGTFGTGSPTVSNPFAVTPETSATKSLFGDGKGAFPNSLSASPFGQVNSNQATMNTFPDDGQSGGQKAATASFLMPPPPNPQPQPQPSASFAPSSTTASQTTHFGSAMVGGLDPVQPTDATAAASSPPTAPVVLEAPKSTGFAAEASSSSSSQATWPLSTVKAKTSLFPLQPAVAEAAAASTTNQSCAPPSVGYSDPATAPSAVSSPAKADSSPDAADTQPESPPARPARPSSPPPPRDMMGDFARWFVLGDNGILEQFQVFVLDEILGKTFAAFQKEAAEKRRKEEEDGINREVSRFRRYNLSLKYFYRWKQNAREKRLSLLRRRGRDELRAFYIAQEAAERKAEQEAAKKAAQRRAELASVDRPDEFADVVRRSKMSRRETRQAGEANERLVLEATTRQGNVSSSPSGESVSGPSSERKLGAKTRALREMYADKQPGGFRRSLPSISSRESESAGGAGANGRLTSNASARWRLKAMGIEQLADGTAVPESMAYDMRSRPDYYASLGPLSSSLGGGGRGRMLDDSPVRRMGIPTVDDGLGGSSSSSSSGRNNNNKRKRWSDEGPGETSADPLATSADRSSSSSSSRQKRIMSEAEKLTDELRAIRQELEEGREWFRAQNERLREGGRITGGAGDVV